MTFLRTVLLFFFFLAFYPQLNAQNDGVSPSERKVNYLNKRSRELRDKGDRDSALYFGQKAKTLSEKLNFVKGKTDAYLNLGVTYRELNRYSEAAKYLNLLIQICNQNHNEIGKGDAYDNFGHLYLAKGDTALALRNHLLSLKIREKAKDEYGKGNSNDNIAQIYASKHDFPNAVKYFEASLKVFEEMKEESRIALSSGNVGSQYYMMANYQAALKNFYKAQKAYKATKNPSGEIWTYSLIANIYSESGDYERALENYRKGLEINKKLGEWWQTVDSYTLIGRTYMMAGNYSEALNYLRKAKAISVKMQEPQRIMIADYFIADIHRRQEINEQALKEFMNVYQMAVEQNSKQWKAASSERIGRLYVEQKNFGEAKKWLLIGLELNLEMSSQRDLSENYHILSEVNQHLGAYKDAYENYKLYVKYRDEVQKNDASKLAMQYEFKKKEAQAKAEQEKKDALTAKEIRNKRWQRNAAIIGLILMTLLVVSLLYLFRLRNKKLAAEKQNVELKRREVEAVKETEQFKSRFLANISHEFRTPLTLISGHLELLKRNAKEQELVRYTEMENNGKRLLKLINQLLDLSKMESGQYHLQFKNGNLLTEIKAHVQAFHSHAGQLGVNLVMEFSESATTNLSAGNFVYSSDGLAIILGNLLSNALKFTPAPGSVQIAVDFLEDSLHISVSDTGPGIPEKQLNKVFDRFYQAEDASQRFQSGSGIGLALVKELAVMHGGNVSVENGINGGCVFKVSLSSMKENTSVSEPGKTEANEFISSEVISTKRGKNDLENEEKPLVLIVEDQEQLRRFIGECLGEQYRYMEAIDGLQGLELAKENLPDLIVSDVMMPGMNGIDLCEKLKTTDLTSHIPVILLTAKAGQEDKELGLETGADDYLTKPFSTEELKLRVRNILRLRESLRKKWSEGAILLTEEIPELCERDREFLQKLTATVESNLSNQQFGVNPLAETVYLSSSQLTRKLKMLTGETPADFIRQIRLQRAVKFLRNGLNVADVAREVGFEDPSYFSKVFKKQFGVSPSEMDQLKSV